MAPASSPNYLPGQITPPDSLTIFALSSSKLYIFQGAVADVNCGKLPENWTVNNLMSKHASRPYNPSIANVFYFAGFIESWGRGIEKICQACDEDGSPRPKYTINPGDIMIQFTAPEDKVIRFDSHGVTAKVTIKVTDKEIESMVAAGNYTVEIHRNVKEAVRSLHGTVPPFLFHFRTSETEHCPPRRCSQAAVQTASYANPSAGLVPIACYTMRSTMPDNALS